ncbi:MAG: acetyl-coenzyme A synthetase N-terminal domain-containing protein, partial [Pseudomonadota bacterium]
MGYRDTYEACRRDPEAFWLSAAERIDWSTPPSRALDAT